MLTTRRGSEIPKKGPRKSRKKEKRRILRIERRAAGFTHTEVAIHEHRQPSPVGTSKIVVGTAADPGIRAALPLKADRDPGFGMPPSPATVTAIDTTPPKATTKDVGTGRALVAGNSTTSGGTAPTAKKMVLAKGKINPYFLHR